MLSDDELLLGLAKMNIGYVYAVRLGDKIKIGKSKNVDRRLQSYRNCSSVFYEIGRSRFTSYHDEERKILSFFGGSPCVKEWFDYNTEMESFLHKYFLEINNA